MRKHNLNASWHFVKSTSIIARNTLFLYLGQIIAQRYFNPQLKSWAGGKKNMIYEKLACRIAVASGDFRSTQTH
jgi:hypothetical protein